MYGFIFGENGNLLVLFRCVELEVVIKAPRDLLDYLLTLSFFFVIVMSPVIVALSAYLRMVTKL